MMKGEFISYIAGIIVLFIVGIVVGYYVWGVEREETANYTEYLSSTIKYIESIEKANLVLTEKTVALQDHIASMSDEANDPEKLREEIDVLNKEIAGLKKKNESLQSTITENGKRLNKAAALQAEHENLLSEVKTLVMQRDTLEAAIDDSKGFIEENDRLRGIIEKLTNALDASKAQIEAIQQVVTPEMVSEQPAQ
ncbi:MAG: hypothetical protein JRC90_10820 [Deltaproteobacteria bacterium]|nr:hypothetical protein [Deltaproteobacteria bacterium]